MFYLVVLGVALAGAGQAATGWLDWRPPFAFAAVAAVELGGVALSVHADERRRLGERALSARLLSTLVAAGAVTTNFFGHLQHIGSAAFFAGMSALGYSVWTIHSGARRRDQLRAVGKIQPTTPAYGVLTWLHHPTLTTRARGLAAADPTLGVLGSLAAACHEQDVRRHRAAIATVLHRKIRATLDPAAADIAVAVCDLDQVAERLRASADYGGLTALIEADLTSANLALPVPADATMAEPAGNPPSASPPVSLPASASAPRTELTPTTVAAQPARSKRRPAVSGSEPGPALERTFALTKQAAASMAASGMDVSQIAVALGVTPRQVRKALQLAPDA